MYLTQEIIIIGAGQAGLASSYLLRKEKIRHIVFEENEIGNSWISQRWDSFKMNTPNWMTKLPGMELPDETREHFMTKDEFVHYLKNYAQKFQLPVKEGHKVVRLEKEKDYFIVTTERNGKQQKWKAKTVIIASGMMNKAKLPELSTKVPAHITQLHASEYRNPNQLPDGGVLVVGAGQSGCQIAEELALSGREVYLASSKVPRAPRRYKGKDVMEWMDIMGIQDITVQQLQENPKLNATQPQSSGMGMFGHTVSYQLLDRLGVTVLGSLENIMDKIVYFKENVKENIRFADESSRMIKANIDAFIDKYPELETGIIEEDLADIADVDFTSASDLNNIALNGATIKTIIWATGFDYDFSYMDTTLLNQMKMPDHTDGKISEGLYCIGFPWLRKKKSGLVYGVSEDAKILIDEIYNKNL